jgi:Na+/proline symporter
LWVLWSRIPGGAGPILAALQEGAGASKLRVLDAGFGGVGPSHTYTLWTALLGFTLLNLGFYGTDQDAMQRMLTCRSARRGAWSMIAAILVGVPVTLLFMLVGLLLWVFYQRPDLMGDAAPSNAPCGSLKVFLHFMLHDLPPGVSGFMMAGLFAAGLSSLNSALSALGSSFVNDFYRKWVRGGSDRHMLWAGRSAVVASGCLVGSFAVFCVHWQQHDQVPLVDFALRVMVFAYAGLVAVFLTILFTNRGSNVTVIAALAVGFGLVVLMQPVVWKTDCYLLSWAARRVDAALADVVEVAAGWRFVYPTAVADVTEAVARWRLAFPWQLTFATGIAVLVCATGRRPEKRGEQHGR